MKVFLAGVTCLLSSYLSFSQTQDQLNQEKYWKYRNRLKTYFMRIGADDGKSIPMSCRIPNWDAATHYDDPDIPDSIVTTLEWRDATISLGYYFILLATEYKLLKATGENTQPTLAELFYALNALNRLDQNAEAYLSPDPDDFALSSDLNGLFLRDDIPIGFESNWLPETLPIDYPLAEGNSSLVSDADFQGYDYDPHYDFYAGNVESLDQLTTVLLGLKFIYQMVDPVVVQPTAEDVPMNLRDETASCILRLLSYMNNVGQPDAHDHEWKILLPNGQLVPRGYDCTMASIPFLGLLQETNPDYFAIVAAPLQIQLEYREKDMCTIIESIFPTFNSEEGSEVLVDVLKLAILYWLKPTTVGTILEADLATWYCDHCAQSFPCYSDSPDSIPVKGPFPIYVDLDKIANLWTYLESQNIPLIHDAEILLCYDPVTYTFDFGTTALPAGTLPQNSDDLCVNLGGLEHALKDDNTHLILEQSLIGNLWGAAYTEYIGDGNNFFHIPLMYDVLFENSTPTSVSNEREFYRDEILAKAPCEGPWADPHNLMNVPMYNGEYSYWASPNRLFLQGASAYGINRPDDFGIPVPDPNYRGYFPGLDYMVYYNLYHLLWGNEPDMPRYTPVVSCECILEITSETELSDTLLVNRYFTDYKEMGIPIQSFLAHSLNMFSGGTLDVQNDLVLCREIPELPTLLTIQNDSFINLYSGNTITVRSGNKIIIENNSTFTAGIGGCAKIVLEENAELIVRSGSTLTSPGGLDLVLHPGAKFIVEDALIDISYGAAGSSINAYENVEIHFTNSTFNVSTTAGINWNMLETSSIVLDNSTVELGDNSNMNLHLETELQVNANSTLFLKENAGLHLWEQAKMKLNGGDVLCYNNSAVDISLDASIALHSSMSSFIPQSGISHINLSGTVDFAAPNLNFTLTETVEGRIVLVLQSQNDHTTGDATNKVILSGLNQNNLIAQIDYGAWFRPSWQLAELEINSGKVEVNGEFHAICNSDLNNVLFTGDGIIKTKAHNNFDDCVFDEVLLSGEFAGTTHKLNLSNCDFINWASAQVNFGGFNISYCSFSFSDFALTASDLLLPSLIENSDFSFCTVGLSDVSDVDVTVKKCNFSDINWFAIEKMDGKLNLRCNTFSDIGNSVLDCALLIEDYCWLNMSSDFAAGYNTFDNCYNNIILDNCSRFDLNNGYNTLAGYTNLNISGVLATRSCTWNGTGNPPNYVQYANNNAWTWANNPIPPVNSDIDVETGNGCVVIFQDNSPKANSTCGQYDNGQIVIVRSGSSEKVDTSHEFLFKDGEENPGNPLIYTEYFDGIMLDDALAVAAAQCTYWNELGDDSIAVALFAQILNSGLDRSIEDIRWKMKWGQRFMKLSLENLFAEGIGQPINNEVDFEPCVSEYVDVLNNMTDTLITDSTYTDQFYLEVDKAQLFRMINRLEMSYELLLNVDNCDLDSPEQEHLNNWLARVQTEMQIVAQSAGFNTDSLNIVVDSTAFQTPIIYQNNEYYFGATIISPGSVVYAPCGNGGYKNFLQSNFVNLVHPNPSNGTFFLDYIGLSGNLNISLLDPSGKLVWTTNRKVSEHEQILIEPDVMLSSGTYHVRTCMNDSVNFQKMVVSR